MKNLLKSIPSVLAIMGVILSFVFFYIFAFKKFAPENKDVIMFILGVLSGIITNIFGYYFGSSKSSSDKQQVINQIAAPVSPVPPVENNENTINTEVTG